MSDLNVVPDVPAALEINKKPVVNVVFTMDEVNSILSVLSEIPAKHVINLINFMSDRAKQSM